MGPDVPRRTIFGSEVLANWARAGFEAAREAYERLGRACESLGSDLEGLQATRSDLEGLQATRSDLEGLERFGGLASH